MSCLMSVCLCVSVCGRDPVMLPSRQDKRTSMSPVQLAEKLFRLFDADNTGKVGRAFGV